MASLRSVRIGLVMQGGADWLGGAQYIFNLARTLKWHAGERVHLTLVGVGKAPAAQPGLWDSVSFEPPPQGRPERTLERALTQLTARRRTLHTLLEHASVDLAFPYFSGRWLPSRVPSAAWIPDFQHLRLPALFSLRERLSRSRHFALIAQGAERLVLSSESARADAEQHFPASRGKTTVVPFHTFLEPDWLTSSARDVADRYALPPRYLLISNQFWQHKNYERVFDALTQLKARGTEVQLVCTGRVHDYRRPGYAEALVAGLTERGLASSVRCLGVIPRGDQIQLMRASLAVLQPSLFEGWSTVVEDARALGKPLILSDLAVHLEQAPPGATYFSAENIEGLAQVLERAWRGELPAPRSDAEIIRRAAANSHAFAERFLSLVPR